MATMKDTADLRARILQLWKLVDEKKIAAAEVRLQISLARTILETIKVEIAASHLAQAQVPAISFTGRVEALPLRRQ